MDTIFMNSKNKKTSDSHKVLLNLRARLPETRSELKPASNFKPL